MADISTLEALLERETDRIAPPTSNGGDANG